jgi:hypothetical protein
MNMKKRGYMVCTSDYVATNTAKNKRRLQEVQLLKTDEHGLTSSTASANLSRSSSSKFSSSSPCSPAAAAVAAVAAVAEWGPTVPLQPVFDTCCVQRIR